MDERQLRDRLPAEVEYEITEHGFYCHRDDANTASAKGGRSGLFREAERFLRDRALRVFDFNMGVEDGDENLHTERGFQPDYTGDRSDGGEPIYRVDHHYEFDGLAWQSTTPMVLEWLLSLHEHGQADVLRSVAAARFVADHCDVDMLFAHHLATMAMDRGYLRSYGGRLAAGALINDHGLIPVELDDSSLLSDVDREQAPDVFFAGLALEKRVRDRRVTFADALEHWLPALGQSIGGTHGKESNELWQAGRELADAEKATQATIEKWKAPSAFKQELAQGLVTLRAEKAIDNLVLLRYLFDIAQPGQAWVQILERPHREPGKVMYKIRSRGLDLGPFFSALREEMPAARFGGRATAGGSIPILPCMDAVAAIIGRVLERDKR